MLHTAQVTSQCCPQHKTTGHITVLPTAQDDRSHHSVAHSTTGQVTSQCCTQHRSHHSVAHSTTGQVTSQCCTQHNRTGHITAQQDRSHSTMLYMAQQDRSHHSAAHSKMGQVITLSDTAQQHIHSILLCAAQVTKPCHTCTTGQATAQCCTQQNGTGHNTDRVQ